MRHHITLGPISLGLHAEHQEHHEVLLYGEWRASYMESDTDTTSIAQLKELDLIVPAPVRPIKAWYFRAWLHMGSAWFSFKFTTDWKVSGPEVELEIHETPVQ